MRAERSSVPGCGKHRDDNTDDEVDNARGRWRDSGVQGEREEKREIVAVVDNGKIIISRNKVVVDVVPVVRG